MFSLARALSSSTSAEDCSSLFGRFIGTTARSDSSGACPPAVRPMAFSGRSRPWLDREVPEVSRFSCMLFLSVRGFLDYAEPADRSRFYATRCVAFSVGDGIGDSVETLFEAQSPGPPMPLSTLQLQPRGGSRKTQGQDGFAFLLSCRALSSPTTCRFIPAHPRSGFELLLTTPRSDSAALDSSTAGLSSRRHRCSRAAPAGIRAVGAQC